MHAIQHECAMRCIQPHVVHVNPCTLPLPLPLPLPMNPIACNMKRADGCKHHLYPARNNKNVLSFLSFTRQNQQNQCIASQPQRVGGGSAIRVLNFSRQLLLYRAARATVVLSRENIPHAMTVHLFPVELVEGFMHPQLSIQQRRLDNAWRKDGRRLGAFIRFARRSILIHRVVIHRVTVKNIFFLII